MIDLIATILEQIAGWLRGLVPVPVPVEVAQEPLPLPELPGIEIP